MSEQHDKRPTVKLEPETVKAVATAQGKFTIKPSRSKLVNAATRIGLKSIKPA